jgi:GntR family transcriptional regulator
MVDFQLDKQSPVPFYRQIIDLVLAGISSQAVLPGEKLPTIRELAVKLEVNPNTVVKAYSQLQILGVLATEQGSGVFVKPQPEDSLNPADRQRRLSALCHDFVGRAQLLGISINELVACLTRMRQAGGSTQLQR